MGLPSLATSSGVFRYGMAFLLLVLALVLLYAIGVMLNLLPPPTLSPATRGRCRRPRRCADSLHRRAARVACGAAVSIYSVSKYLS